MCKIGDIILVEHFKNEYGIPVARHPFIVIEDERGYVTGLPFDFIGVLISSFKNEQHRNKKLRYDANIALATSDGVKRASYAKTDQLYYFNKDNIQFRVVGEVTEDILENIMEVVKDTLEKETSVAVFENISK